MDHLTVARKGGRTILAKYGPEHLAKIGRRGGAAMMAKYGPEYFKELSRLGVEARKNKKKRSS